MGILAAEIEADRRVPSLHLIKDSALDPYRSGSNALLPCRQEPPCQFADEADQPADRRLPE